MQQIQPHSSKSKPAPRRNPPQATAAAVPHRALYDGRDRLGEIAQNGQEYRAYGRRGQPLGMFDTAQEAAEAIAEAAS
jgi:hypothetical protein